jgi:hypothetical protein
MNKAVPNSEAFETAPTNPTAEQTGYGCLGKVFFSGYVP